MPAGRRAVGFVVAVSLVAVLLAPAGEVRAQGTDILSVGQQGEMKTRNFLTALAWEDPHTMSVLARVYDTAVQRDPSTGEIVPRLAVGIDGNGNGLLDPAEAGRFAPSAGARDVTVFYNFTPATFHDGVPLDAMDVLFSYHVLAMQPMTSGPLRVLMGSNYTTTRWLWVLPVDDGDGDPDTAALRFTLQFTYGNFPWSTLGIPVLPRHIWEGTGGGRHADFGIAIYPEADPRRGQGVPPSETTYKPFDLVAATGWQLTDADVIGSGHFRFGTWSFGLYVRLDANLEYAFGRPKVDEILFKVYRTTQLGVLALMAGEIDLWFAPLPPEFVPDLMTDPDIAIVNATDVLPITFEFNMRRVPFGYATYPPVDPRADDIGLPFRQAFAHLIDAQTVLRSLLQDNGFMARGMVSPADTVWYNATLPVYQYNPAMAAAILDNQGWVDTNGDGWRDFPRIGSAQIDILSPQADYDPIRASIGAMAAAAARSIRMNVGSWPTSFGAIEQAVLARDFDIVLLGGPDQHAYDPWTLSRGDPDYLLDLFHSTNAAAGRNHAGFQDVQFDSEAEAARAAPDLANRTWHVGFEQGILAERLPVIPTVYRNLTWAYRVDRFQGWLLVGTTLFNYWTLQGLHIPHPPVILLNYPQNGSRIRRGTAINLDVVDADLASVTYTVDSGPPATLPAPYDVDTSSWADGSHTLAVTARDAIGDETRASYGFVTDGTPPDVVAREPSGDAVALNTTIRVRFSESVNRLSAERAFSLTDGTTTWDEDDGTFTWAANSTSFVFTPATPLSEGRTYTVRLASNLTDIVGNPMAGDDVWGFSTPRPLAAQVLPWIAGAVAVAAALAAAVLLVRRRRREKPGPGTGSP